MLNFLVIGSQKCGTTWLFDKLKMHPKLYFPFGKEAHFWNRRFYLSKEYQTLYNAAMNGPVVDLSGYVCGELTPKYAIMSPDQIQKLWKRHPDIKIFLMVRNPIERAWSAMKMTYKYNGKDVLSIKDEDIARLLTKGETASLGKYDVIIENWLSFYDPSQLKLIFFDDIKTDYRNIIQAFCYDVKVDPDFFDLIPNTVLKSPSLEGSNLPLCHAIYKDCLDFYRPSIEFLSSYTGRDLSTWLSVS